MLSFEADIFFRRQMFGLGTRPARRGVREGGTSETRSPPRKGAELFVRNDTNKMPNEAGRFINFESDN
jgi:hypothetical protein